LGLLIAAMLAADMSTNSSYMLAWSSIIFNDILRPFKWVNRSGKSGLRLNRMLIVFIGVFLLLYGLWYPLKGDLWVYLQLTGTVYLSSMSVLLIAACYWKRANARGAVAAIVVGAIVPLGYLVAQQVEATQGLASFIGPYWSGISTYILAAGAMVVGSLSKPQSSLGS
jgi:SSS family solute:Na+ symporter